MRNLITFILIVLGTHVFAQNVIEYKIKEVVDLNTDERREIPRTFIIDYSDSVTLVRIGSSISSTIDVIDEDRYNGDKVYMCSDRKTDSKIVITWMRKEGDVKGIAVFSGKYALLFLVEYKKVRPTWVTPR